MNNMREVLSVGCSHTSCITSLSFHGGWEKNIMLEMVQRMICLWASNGSCQLLQMSMPYFLPCSHFLHATCTAHSHKSSVSGLQMALVSCQLLQMSMPYFLPCSHFLHATCTAHSHKSSVSGLKWHLSVVNCYKCQCRNFYHVVISCMQHVQLILGSLQL